MNFTPGSARLSNIAKAKLDEVALRMKQDPELRAQVLGYTDASGSPEGNQRISEQRAQAVKNYLVTRHGIGVRPQGYDADRDGDCDRSNDDGQQSRHGWTSGTVLYWAVRVGVGHVVPLSVKDAAWHLPCQANGHSWAA